MKIIIPDKMETQWLDNYSANMKSGVFHRSLPYSAYKRNMSGNHPAVLVGASPHLDNNVHKLVEYQDKAVIICVDVALPCLIASGIRPDIVVTLDPSPLISKSFVGINHDDVVLIAPTTAHPDTLAAWSGPVVLFNQGDFNWHSKDYTRPKGRFFDDLTRPTASYGFLFNVGFVGATAYQVAIESRPSAIILMGYGFSFKDKRVYCTGVAEKRQRDILIPSGAYSAGREMTTKIYMQYCTKFKQIIQRLSYHVINATEGGLLFHNNLEAGAALATWCTRPISKAKAFRWAFRYSQKVG